MDRSGADDAGVTPGRRLAPRGYRFIARSLDVTVMAFLLAFVYVEVVRRLNGTGETNLLDAVRGSGLSMRLTFLCLGAVYEVLPVALSGRTFGKAMLGLKVVRVDDPAAPVGVTRSLGRWVIPGAALALPKVGVLAYAVIVGWMLVDRRRQGLHDRLAGTIVIDVGLGRHSEVAVGPRS